ncbi:hypothetical protein FA13DRAFT_592421 [Coprinellus micaceus]|uniref:Uncharacterized protein n=1 Tax=Coprinellus micaceus TaxID=71717 RepID=A0A4Y7SB29_COPMI|nr:hypothetical protein FA13DRAFT_592421 [Coprinellus micaceus]
MASIPPFVPPFFSSKYRRPPFPPLRPPRRLCPSTQRLHRHALLPSPHLHTNTHPPSPYTLLPHRPTTRSHQPTPTQQPAASPPPAASTTSSSPPRSTSPSPPSPPSPKSRPSPPSSSRRPRPPTSVPWGVLLVWKGGRTRTQDGNMKKGGSTNTRSRSWSNEQGAGGPHSGVRTRVLPHARAFLHPRVSPVFYPPLFLEFRPRFHFPRSSFAGLYGPRDPPERRRRRDRRRRESQGGRVLGEDGGEAVVGVGRWRGWEEEGWGCVSLRRRLGWVGCVYAGFGVWSVLPFHWFFAVCAIWFFGYPGGSVGAFLAGWRFSGFRVACARSSRPSSIPPLPPFPPSCVEAWRS